MVGKGQGLNPVFKFWINEEEALHSLLLNKMLEAAASERWNIPIIATKFTGEDVISIVKTYEVVVLGNNIRPR